MTPLFVAVATVVGIALGPLLHHVAVRAAVWAPFGPSAPACESCGTSLGGFGLVAATCGACGTRRRTLRELAISLITGALFGAAAGMGGNPAIVSAHLLLAAVSVVLFFTDIDQKIIPNRVLYPGGAMAVSVLGIGAALDGNLNRFGMALVTGAGYFALFYLVAVIARGGFGFGDVKLAALLGTFTGYPSWEIFATALFLTGFAGAIPALVLLVTRRGSAKRELPYGPAMLFGAWVALLFGQTILSWM